MANENKIPNSAAEKSFFKSLFAEMNRGILLDVVVFLLNLLLMRYLTKGFVEVIQWANAGDFLA